MGSDTATLFFQPAGRSGRVPMGISLVEASRLLGVDIEAPCGEKHICGKCKVRIVEGTFKKHGILSNTAHAGPWQDTESAHITAEEKNEGFRLGCIATVHGDLTIFVPEEARASKQVVSKAARPMAIGLNPAVEHYYVEVAEPSLTENMGDYERICLALERKFGLLELKVDIVALRSIPKALRAGNWAVTVSIWLDQEIIRVRPGRAAGTFGLALDVGTTTIAAYLCDLSTGEVVNTAAVMNPQVKYGDDVVSRISYHMQHADGLERMSRDLIAALNSLVDQLVAGGGESHPRLKSSEVAKTKPPAIEREDIEDVAVACNTAMHHIMLRLDPEPLGAVPFAPSIQHSIDVKVRDLGINVNSSAYVFFLPNIAGYVGGDHVGVILAEEPHKSASMQLIIDIGTNGELVLGNKDRLVCCSCATGPALEGAQIEFGMRASDGAIERVKIDPQTHEVDFKVIGRDAWRSYSEPGEMKTRGICGSGILDALAELFLAGIVMKSGAFCAKGEKSNRLRKNPQDGRMEFVLAWAEETVIGEDIAITQKDIRQLQLAKAAIYTGCKLLMRKMGTPKIDEVKIAGAFGTHVDRKGAMAIGLFPDCPLASVNSVGNAAGDGCRVALLDRNKRIEANRIARQVECVELTLETDFQRELIESTQLPHMTDLFPHLPQA